MAGFGGVGGSWIVVGEGLGFIRVCFGFFLDETALLKKLELYPAPQEGDPEEGEKKQSKFIVIGGAWSKDLSGSPSPHLNSYAFRNG